MIMLIIIVIITIMTTIITISEIKNRTKHIKFENTEGTIFDLIKQTVISFPNSPALFVKRQNEWISVSYAEYFTNIQKFAQNINYFFGPNINIGIIGYNSVAWFYTHLGTIMNGGISVGIYLSSIPPVIDYMIEQSNIKILVIDDTEQLEKCLNIKSKPELIIYYGNIKQELVKYTESKIKIRIMSFAEFINFNSSIELDIIFQPINPSKAATIIYTSGTTGQLKGAIITHNNIYSMVRLLIEYFTSVPNLNIEYGAERFVSFLPLNHIAAQLMDIYLPFSIAGSVWFADRLALRSTLVYTLNAAKPTVFMAVPRVWEKLAEKIEHKLNKENYSSLTLAILWKIISYDIIDNIGLLNCKLCITGGAPVSEICADYLHLLGLNLYNIYGMTETTGPISIAQNPHDAGVVLPEINIRYGTGNEILVRGPTVFNGYLSDEKSTAESFVIDKEKQILWFKTGDIGKITQSNDSDTDSDTDSDPDTYDENTVTHLKITARKKDIIITSGGEKIYPADIEFQIKNNIKFISNVVLIGDKRKYLSALLTFRVQTTNTGDLTVLLDDSIKISGSDALTTSDAIDDPQVKSYIQAKIDEINTHAISNAHHIQKWIVLPNEFSIKEGEITSVLKIKRYYIMEKYKEQIDKMYE